MLSLIINIHRERERVCVSEKESRSERAHIYIATRNIIYMYIVYKKEFHQWPCGVPLGIRFFFLLLLFCRRSHARCGPFYALRCIRAIQERPKLRVDATISFGAFQFLYGRVFAAVLKKIYKLNLYWE